MNRNLRGNLLMAFGLLLIAAALLLTCKNVREETAARDSSAQVLEELQALLPGKGSEQMDMMITDPDEQPAQLGEMPAEADVQLPEPEGEAAQPGAQIEANVQPAQSDQQPAKMEEHVAQPDEQAASETADEPVSPEATVQDEVQAEIYFSDHNGTPVSWPVDAAGDPVSWPVNNQGKPLERVIAPDGTERTWPTDAAGAPLPWRIGEGEHSASMWTETSEGALLPWVSDGRGHTVPYPTDTSGRQLDWETVRTFWNSLLNGLLRAYTAPVVRADFEIQQEIEMPVTEIKGNYYIGVLSLMERGMEFPIMSDWSYPKLRIAPCRYAGSAYNGSLVIAGHNYSGHFGTVRNLQVGEQMSFTDVDGNVFYYVVSEIENVNRTGVQEMIQGDWDMTLFTCVSGTRYRFAVRCEKTGHRLAA